MYLEIIQ
ncbi:hypothetical protein VCHC56A2_2760, partial [Vibrio cholerae HC-56A2]